MRFITFLSIVLVFAVLTAAPYVSDARPRHIPSMCHAKSQNDQSTAQSSKQQTLEKCRTTSFLSSCQKAGN